MSQRFWHRVGGHQRVTVLCVLALGGLVVSAVVASAQNAPVLLPPSPSVLSVTMTEYHLDIPPAVPPGRVTFRVGNAGRLHHQVILARVPDDMPPLDVQLRGWQRRPVDTYTALPPLQPDGRGIFAADLAPGRYALVCFLPDADGTNHAVKGMSAELRVG